MILNERNKEEAKRILNKVVDMSVEFKMGEFINSHFDHQEDALNIIESMPRNGEDIYQVIDEFENKLLKYSANFSSKNFMGFPDSGNAVASMAGSILAELLQQNLINQSFCAKTATFAEIAVIQWLRETVGYETVDHIENIWDVGGLITPGGTSSNCIAMMLARENHDQNTLKQGVYHPDKYKIIIPKGICHYSIKSSQMWLGLGNNLIEVETENFKYNQKELRSALRNNKGNVMSVVCYAGDSRSMTIDHLGEIYSLVKEIDENIWLHCDACHGFSLGFSDTLKKKIESIHLFDSITTDPHKVLCTPYVISSLLIRDSKRLQSITSFSDLIMNENFAFGQITPFLGSRNWASLKLWFLIKNLGRSGIAKIIENRHQLAQFLHDTLSKHKKFIVLNEVGINSVMFMYISDNEPSQISIEKVNKVNQDIHQRMLQEGKFHLHQFPIPDNGGVLQKNAIVYPLRYMSGNPNTTKDDILNLIDYIETLAETIESEEVECKMTYIH